MDVGGEEPEETVTKRALEGTLGILKSCRNSKTVKRVVYTSSVAAVLYNDQGLEMADEDTWSDLEVCRRCELVSSSYLVSKTVTEKAALEFGEENGMEVVSLVLPLVVGPFICPKMPSSVCMGLAMILGEQSLYKYLLNSYMVHIDDATSALIFLFENPYAKGRYICSSNQISLQQMYEFLTERYAQYQISIPDNLRERRNPGQKVCFLSSRKLLNTGFKVKYGINEIFDEAIQCCRDKGFL